MTHVTISLHKQVVFTTRNHDDFRECRLPDLPPRIHINTTRRTPDRLVSRVAPICRSSGPTPTGFTGPVHPSLNHGGRTTSGRITAKTTTRGGGGGGGGAGWTLVLKTNVIQRSWKVLSSSPLPASLTNCVAKRHEATVAWNTSASGTEELPEGRRRSFGGAWRSDRMRQAGPWGR